MSSIYSVTVSVKPERPDGREATLRVTSLQDAWKIPDSRGFVMMVLAEMAHDVGAGSPLARVVPRDSAHDEEWLAKNAAGFVESVEKLSVEHGDDEAVELSASLRIRATRGAWIQHLRSFTVWDTAAFDPRVTYLEREPEEPPTVTPLQTDQAQSAGFLPILGRFLDDRLADELVWTPRYDEAAYEAPEPLTMQSFVGGSFQTEITREALTPWVGRVVVCETPRGRKVRTLVACEEDAFFLTRLGYRKERLGSSHHYDDVTSVGLAAYRPGPWEEEPLDVGRAIDSIPARLVSARIDGNTAVLDLELTTFIPPYRHSAEILGLLVAPLAPLWESEYPLARSLASRGSNLIHIFPEAANGYIATYDVGEPSHAIEPPEWTDDAAVVSFFEETEWPTMSVSVEVTDPAWLDHLREPDRRLPMLVPYREYRSPETCEPIRADELSKSVDDELAELGLGDLFGDWVDLRPGALVRQAE